MRVLLSNLGCKLNQAEIERLARDFVAEGHSIVGSLDEAEVHVVNSCTVTHAAARDSRKLARRAGRLDGEIRTVLTGCYVNGSPEETATLAGVDLVVPNERKETLVDEVARAFPELASPSYAADPLSPYMPIEHLNTRALVKVEDGCNMPCTFCIIPSTRGNQHSRPLDEVVAEVGSLVETGYQEIVITGVQISSYRWQGAGLHDLVSALLDRTTVPRLRLTSIAPWQFNERLFDLFDSGRLCRHVHLSLQSGCDATLERMRRPYTAGAFAALIESVRSRIPGVAVTTDVIVGFPGESDDEFSRSLEFTRQMQFARIHAFPYSPRPGTEAAEMPGQVEHQIKKERMRQMLLVAGEAQRRFQQSQTGEIAEVLWEHRRSGHWIGMSDNYIRVSSTDDRQANTLDRVTLVRPIGSSAALSAESSGKHPLVNGRAPSRNALQHDPSATPRSLTT